MTSSFAAPLPLQSLGRSGMALSRVGFGAWALGGGDWQFGWGEQDERASVQAIWHACELGVNWIDTAAAYGLGRSEVVVAKALSEMPSGQRPYVFTKCGVVWDEQEPTRELRLIGRPESIRREAEGSLRRLGVDCLDLYQMHRPPTDGTRLEEYWQTMVDLKREGKVRAIGLSNHSVEQLEAAEKIGHVDSLQPPLSAIRRDAALAELPWCRSHETGVIVYSPMQSGLLTGSFTAERARSLPANDWRSRSPHFTGEGLVKNLALAEALKPIAARRQVDVAAVAIAWTLAWPGVTAAIVGARSPAQVDGWIAAARLHLSDDETKAIGTAIARTGAGTGPASPPPI